MAKYETYVNGDFFSVINSVVTGIQEGSVSATLEESSDFTDGDAKCSVRVFERYSYMGGNRVSLSVTFFQVKYGKIHISAVTSGGSQAMFIKLNTWGEEAFLDKFCEIIKNI